MPFCRTSEGDVGTRRYADWNDHLIMVRDDDSSTAEKLLVPLRMYPFGWTQH